MRQIHTPCIKICELDKTGEYCIGCKRTKQEILEWCLYTEEQQLSKIEELKKRNTITF